MILLSRSRPEKSVPHKCSAEGLAKAFFMSILYGSYGAKIGANIPTRTNKITMTPPILQRRFSSINWNRVTRLVLVLSVSIKPAVLSVISDTNTGIYNTVEQINNKINDDKNDGKY